MKIKLEAQEGDLPKVTQVELRPGPMPAFPEPFNCPPHALFTAKAICLDSEYVITREKIFSGVPGCREKNNNPAA